MQQDCEIVEVDVVVVAVLEERVEIAVVVVLIEDRLGKARDRAS